MSMVISLIFILFIPQGSILGTLLFLVYINDFPESTTYFSSRLYADDTSLTASGTNLNILFNDINNNLQTV